MCGLYKTTCIMTLLSVTICLVMLHFTTGLKVLPTEDQNNNMMTQVAEVTVKCVNWVMMFLFFLPEDDWNVKKVKSSSYPCYRWRTRRGVGTEGFLHTFNIYILYYRSNSTVINWYVYFLLWTILFPYLYYCDWGFGLGRECDSNACPFSPAIEWNLYCAC